ncbi:ribosome silencing factor [Rhodoblastus sphagnicola]|uniref:ribosome silencing factor n=1 Tax=Rhodoblastus sphagnicola TaxID=333368 RepID=UPI003CC87B2F
MTRKPSSNADEAATTDSSEDKASKPRARKAGTAEVKTAEPRPEAPVELNALPAELQAAVTALEDLKAEEISLINLEGKTSIADWMVIASGRSTTQVGALADRVVRALKDMGAPTPAVEGVPACDWVLIDAGDVIVHLFRPEVRAFYNLEKMWGVDRPTEARTSA